VAKRHEGRKRIGNLRQMHYAKTIIFAALALAIAPAMTARAETDSDPERVTMPSADGHTTLVGYVFKPANTRGARLPAVVMMHGRAGPYSSAAKGVYDGSTLSRRHKQWGELWADEGYIAIMVDSFGPRGYPKGFGRNSYDDRPEALNEVTIRPLDAYGALAYLRSRPDVAPDLIGLQGWSNGGSAGLATMAVDAPGITNPTPQTGFRAALVFYPACGLKGHFDDKGYVPYAPVRVFHGSSDEEVSPRRCAELVERSRKLGGDISIRFYRGATHGFDDPNSKRQRVDANADAREDAIARSVRFFAQQLKAP
jgi:dienelactone hydrolase